MIYTWINKDSFVPQDEERYICKLQKGELTMTKLTLEEKQELIRMALAARERAYAPYSDFMVGAALRAEDGRIFTGCNVENAAFTPTSCAERTALFKAVAEGVTRFTDIAVVGARRGEVNKQITSPCGVCRQALFEFGGPELNVIMAKSPGRFHRAQHGRSCCPSASAPPTWQATRLWKTERSCAKKAGRSGFPGISVIFIQF